MSRLLTTSIRIAAWMATVFLLVVAWPFAVPGTMLAIFREKEYPRYLGSALALIAVVAMRSVTGAWFVRTDAASSGPWYVGWVVGTVSWALGSILVAAGFRLASYVLDRNARGSRNALPGGKRSKTP